MVLNQDFNPQTPGCPQVSRQNKQTMLQAQVTDCKSAWPLVRNQLKAHGVKSTIRTSAKQAKQMVMSVYHRIEFDEPKLTKNCTTINMSKKHEDIIMNASPVGHVYLPGSSPHS